MDNEKKTLIMSTIATIALIAIVVGATYAYFEAQNETSGGSDIGVDAATTDVFRLTSSDAIELNANPSNFKQGDANLVGEAQASAYLRANNNTNTATYNYYVYLDIEENDFVYSVDSNTPELLLKVYEGEIGENEVTSIPGLTRKTTEDVEGFDITGITKAITLVDNKEITTTSEIEEKWSIEIIFVNLESDQKANQGKNFTSKLMIQNDEIIPNVCNEAIITVNNDMAEGAIFSVAGNIYTLGNNSNVSIGSSANETLGYLAEAINNDAKVTARVKGDNLSLNNENILRVTASVPNLSAEEFGIENIDVVNLDNARAAVEPVENARSIVKNVLEDISNQQIILEKLSDETLIIATGSFSATNVGEAKELYTLATENIDVISQFLDRLIYLIRICVNGTYDTEEQRSIMQNEVNLLIPEINKLVSETTYNNINILDGTIDLDNFIFNVKCGSL
ncbi:MAG: hypothetical protein E7172_04095 [Firmicutes bacterium]|nr:hypothetical protein [Bacillota bacterium]